MRSPITAARRLAVSRAAATRDCGRAGRHRNRLGQEAAPDSAIKKGEGRPLRDCAHAQETRRKDGTYIRFDSNAAVLVNEVNEPVGTRVFGPVARELRDKKFMKIVSLAPEVI